MGYRLHYATKYDIEWSREFGNHVRNLNLLLFDNIEECYALDGYNDENSMDFEILRSSLEEFVNGLKSNKRHWKKRISSDYEEIFESGYTLNDIIKFLDESIKRSPQGDPMVHFSWF
jgi:hypothetical protein